MPRKQLGHGHIDDQGKHHGTGHGSDEYQHGIDSLPGKVFQPFGHFGPMIHNAPVHSMMTPHRTVTHLCGSKILHDGRSLFFECGGCGAMVTDHSELTSLSA
jgi:hypothetical protein